MAKISLIVNGNPVNANIDPRTLLVQFLRENLRLTGHPCRLRYLAMRRLRRASRRQGGQGLHHTGCDGRRP